LISGVPLVQIDPRRHLPIYLQIAEAIRGAVTAGTYRPGEALPSLRELAVTLRVNPNTVQRAYDELSREGIAESRRGLGLFVAERAAADARPRTVEELRGEFERWIRVGLAAGLSRNAIAVAFRSALRAATKSPPGRRPPSPRAAASPPTTSRRAITETEP
jgi:GntR family transcriptional regulator